MDAKADKAGNTSCSRSAPTPYRSTDISTVAASLNQEDPCSPDPDGSKHKCFADCTECYQEGSLKWCKPPAGGGFGCNTGYDCKYLTDDQSCNLFCGCTIKPPPGQCPRVSDEQWATCRDPSKGGMANCVWCQNQHTCVDSHGKLFPKGYDPSCGNPTSTSLSLMVLENNEVSTNLCVFKCDGDQANYVCMADDCPDNYGGCERAFWYVVSADGCGELASHAYDAGGQKIEDQESAHVSINGNAMHQVSQALVKSRLQALQSGSMVSDVSADDIAQGVQALEEKGLSKAENALCSWATGAMGFCGFLVNSPVVQWVNKKLVNLPFASQVTHQIATMAAGALKPVADVVQGALGAVAKAVNVAKGVIDACKNAAVNIVHSVLHWFGWMDRSIFAILTGERGPILKIPPPQLVV